MRAFLLVLAALLVPILMPLGASAQTFEGLGDLPGGDTSSEAVAVSADGRIVIGVSNAEGGTTSNGLRLPYRWENGTMTALPYFTGRFSSFATPTGISDDGRIIVGTSSDDIQSGQVFVRWVDGEIERLSVSVATDGGGASAVSADGSVIVGGALRYPAGGGEDREAFRWENGTSQGLGYLPGAAYSSAVDVSADGSVVVGTSSQFINEAFRPYRWTGSMEALPFPSGSVDGFATAVSADGSVVVGATGDVNDYRATRWTSEGGFLLPELAGATFSSADAVSADGSVIVGSARIGNTGFRTWIWTEADGTRDLFSVLTSNGLNLDGWALERANDISDDGTVIVGRGINPSGNREAFRINLASTWAPAEDEIVPPDATYEVQYVSPDGAATVDLYLVSNSQSSEGTRVRIAQGLNAADGTFEWEVPDDLLSPSTFLIAVDASDASQEVVGPRFRVRPRYRLLRVTGTVANPDYELAGTDRHVWTFEQSGENLWPESYWNRPERYYDGFPDFGADPFYAEPDVRYLPLGFPDAPYYWYTPWTAWVDAFGTGATYTSLDPIGLAGFTELVNQPDLGAFEAWRDAQSPGYGETVVEAAANSYLGVCFGLSNAMLAAFGDADRFTAAWLPSLNGGDIASLGATDAVRDVAHALQNRTRDERFGRSRDNQLVFDPATPRSVLGELKGMLERDVRDLDRVVWFTGQTTDTDADGDPLRAAHAVAPLGLEDEGIFAGVDAGEPGDGRYAFVFYDPNLGGAAVMPLDSTANAWGPYDFWRGETGGGLFVGTLVLDVYDVGNPSWLGTGAQGVRRTGEPDLVSVYVSGRSSAVIAPNGDRVAYERGVITETLDLAYVRFPITGVPSRPEAYRVPRGAYSAEVTPDEGGFARLSVDWGRLRLGVERTDGLPEARDALALDPAGTATLTSAGGEVRLRALTTVGVGEARLFVADSLAVGAGTEARLAMTADSSAFALGGLAEDGAYDLTLAVSVPGVGSRSFYHADVALPAGATHTVRPTWPTLGDEDVTIDVDTDGDGETDETLVLPNEGLPVSSEEEASTLPAVFALGAYPNPTAGTTTIEVALPEATDVRAEVYDVLGRRVALLADGPLAAGTHALAFDVARLPAGLYVVRAATPEATLTRRLTVVR